MKTLIIIPSRLSATRLPRKPLLKINDISIISHVYKRAKEANIGEVARQNKINDTEVSATPYVKNIELNI